MSGINVWMIEQQREGRHYKSIQESSQCTTLSNPSSGINVAEYASSADVENGSLICVTKHQPNSEIT